MKPEFPSPEVQRLQLCINDLVSVLALPAMWAGSEPAEIVRRLLDSLLEMLRLDLVYLRLREPIGDAPMESVRTVAWSGVPTGPEKVGALLQPWLSADPQTWPPRIEIGTAQLSVVPLRLGLQGAIGLLAAGTCRPDFPQQTERLVLSVAANQATIGLQGAQHLIDQKRLAAEAAQEELRDTQAELAHMTRVMTMGHLTASIAHELNQPLAGIITNASTCLRMLAADPPNVTGAGETARRTIRDANRAAEVISRLRALFSKRSTAVETVDLNTATQEVIALTSTELQRNSVNLRLDLADDLPFVKGDRVQLQQVIMNLVLNAVEAMDGVTGRPKDLTVATESDGADRVRVIVRDAGVGIDSTAAAKLFNPFYTTKSHGMGIGLSVSRSIVEHHQGRLWAEANDGPGATFLLSIPTRPDGDVPSEHPQGHLLAHPVGHT